MASTNKTPNYNLSQFQPTNKLERTDYNSDMSKIDTAIKANATNIGLLDTFQKLTKITVSTQAQLDNAIDELGTSAGNAMRYSYVLAVDAAGLTLPAGTWLLEGINLIYGNRYDIQKAYRYDATGVRFHMRSRNNGIWNSWVQYSP